MHKAIHLGAGHIAPNDLLPIHQQRGIDLCLVRVVLHLVQILGANLPGVGLQVKTLGLLHHVIGGVHIVKLGGNHHFPSLRRLLLHLPAKALQIGHPLFVGAAGDGLRFLLSPALQKNAGPHHNYCQQQKGKNSFSIGFQRYDHFSTVPLC